MASDQDNTMVGWVQYRRECHRAGTRSTEWSQGWKDVLHLQQAIKCPWKERVDNQYTTYNTVRKPVKTPALWDSPSWETFQIEVKRFIKVIDVTLWTARWRCFKLDKVSEATSAGLLVKENAFFWESTSSWDINLKQGCFTGIGVV